VLVAVILPAAGLVLLACLGLGGIVAPWLSARAARTQELRTAEARAEMTAVSLELLEGAGPLTVAGQVEERLGALRASDRALAHATRDGAQTAGLAAALGMVALGVAVLGALWLGIPEVAGGSLAPVRLPIIVLVPLAAFETLVVLPAAAVQLHRSGQAALRIVELLDRAAAEASPGVSGAAQGGTTGPIPGATRTSATEEAATRSPHALEAQDLACGWPGRPPALEAVQLALRPGRAIAVVGASGVGKSTLLMTLAGLLPPRGGTLRLDGSEVTFPGDDGLRAATLFSAEDAHVFETTVFENLRVARGDLERAEATSALRWAGLASWLEALPQGLDTPLGPDGSSISGGERRRLLLARARLSRAPFLFVDEPAEHLDPRAADELVHALLQLARADASTDPARAQPQRGVILASHRLSALQAADEVIVLGRSGNDPIARVVARGTHAQLLETRADYRWAVAQELA
jgi:ATP-binding cassette subfamily C protein CydC